MLKENGHHVILGVENVMFVSSGASSPPSKSVRQLSPCIALLATESLCRASTLRFLTPVSLIILINASAEL